LVTISLCTLVQALRLFTGHTTHRGSRGIAVLFLEHGTRRGWAVSIMPRPPFNPGKDPVPSVQEAGWTPGPVWTGVENLAPTGFDPQTVQPVASCYTDWATQPTGYNTERKKMLSRNTIKFILTYVWKLVFLCLIERLHPTVPSLCNLLQVTIHLHILNTVTVEFLFFIKS